jgi:hypothetical protein
MRRINKILYAIALVGLVLSTTGCINSYLDPTLEQQKDLETSINSDEDLYGILKGALNRMTSSSYYGRDMIINNECRTDNTFANGNSGRFTTVAGMVYNPSSNVGVWTEAYRVISSANLIINADPAELDGDAEYISHLQGEALALRALAHFDLMRNYGEQYTAGDKGVPYVTEFKGNEESPKRLAIDDVKKAIYKDLTEAYAKMSENLYDDSKEFVSKITAKAIESKVATYFGDWDIAKKASKAVIDYGKFSIIPKDEYVSSFGQKGSKNSIFELAFSPTDNQGINGLGFIYRYDDGYGDIEVLENAALIFDPTDVRGDGGIIGLEGTKIRNLGKYPELNGYDNVNIIRYEEIILNYAEALLMNDGDGAGAATQLNLITAQRGASDYKSPATLDDILLERRKELMFEGFRFDDLVRTGKGIPKVDPKQNISSPIPKGDFRLAFPIPITEMDANSNMQQNNGYN